MTRYLNLAEYFVLAEMVTGVPAETLTKASRIDLADSALHAPQAGFGDEDFYPDLFEGGCAVSEARTQPSVARRQQTGGLDIDDHAH